MKLEIESPNIINNIHCYIEKIMGKENIPNNAIQIDDPDEPVNINSIKIVKITKKGEDRNIKKNIFYLIVN